jgi:hypothetical protein
MAEQLKIHFTHTEEGEIAPYKSTFGFNPKVKPYDGLTGSITIPIWNTYEGMKFDGSYKIRDHHDVAHLMKALESKSVELGFAVHVNDKQEAMIQFLSIGGRAGTVLDTAVILAGSKLHDSKEIYLVHNHPSGNLKPSQADVSLTKRVQEGFSKLGIDVYHIILNTYKTDFTVILEDGHSIFSRDESLKEGKHYSAHVFDEMKVLREPISKITGSKDVAELIQQTRFSALPKHGILVLSSDLSVTGNYFVDDLSLKMVTDIIAHLPGARSLIIYGNTNQEGEMIELRKSLMPFDYDLLDYIQVNSNANGVKAAYKSYADEGLLNETLEKYGTNQIKQAHLKQNPKPWERSPDSNDTINWKSFTR